MQQLPLPIGLRVDATIDSFVVGANASLVRALTEPQVDFASAPWLFWHGPTGCGRSHLLHACAGFWQALGARIAVLPLQMPALSPAHLEGLEFCDMVLLDDIDAVIGDKTWAVALFHLCNRLRDNGKRLLITSVLPPQELNCALADLQSRLCAMLVFGVHDLADDDKRQLVQQRASARGLQLNDEVAHYLLNHGQRSVSALLQLLDVLDQASLAEQRRLTTPFVKQVMGW